MTGKRWKVSRDIRQESRDRTAMTSKLERNIMTGWLLQVRHETTFITQKPGKPWQESRDNSPYNIAMIESFDVNEKKIAKTAKLDQN